ncbi:MAG: hypothetical protein IKA12_01425, partial [Clostridia bacterium]|nr:hypothetical protein [Clostridia bacterium]
NLDLVKATGKLGLEMRTMAGSSSMPIFEKASITVKMDSNWLVTEVQTSSIYTVNILGGVTCTESVTEKFSNYNADVKIPDYDFYNYYVDAEVEDPEEATLTATDYIMQGFGDYISGTKPIKANLSVNSKDLGLKLSVNLQLGINLEDLSALSLRLDVNELTYNDLSINGLFLAYQNQNIYIKIGDFKAVTTLEELSSKAQEICSLLNVDLSGALNLFESFESFDASNLLANAILVENEKSATVTLPINFGELSLNAVLTFNTEHGIVPEKLSATLKQTEIELSVNDTLTVTETGEGYNAITPLLNLISNLSNVKAEISIGDINALLSYNLNSSCLDVYVDELNLGEINLGEIKAKLINGEVYLNVKGIPAKFALCDIQPVLSKISAIIGKEITLPSLDGLKNINLEEIITTAISSLTAKFENNTLSLSTEIFGETILIDLLVTENGYELGDLSLILRGTQITARLTNK